MLYQVELLPPRGVLIIAICGESRTVGFRAPSERVAHFAVKRPFRGGRKVLAKKI
jgi:hypothetical protein